jgi:pimeloyl-ACP methyl ester carboxylesterase
MECTVKNLKIHYESIGQGQPILMIHGYHVDYRLMSGCMEPIFQQTHGYRRIYVDLPGMGKTKSAPWIVNSDVMLDILAAFIDEVIPGERFLLAGESYGGYLARGIIWRMAERVAGLMLLCPAIEADYNKRTLPPKVVLKKDESLLARLTPSEAEEFEDVNVVQTQEVWERFRDEILSGIRLADKPFLDWFRENGYAFTFDVDKLQKPYPYPALILLGRQDTSVGYRDALSILENYPRASYVILDMAGHNLQIEQAGLFRALTMEWLDRVQDCSMNNEH